MPFISKCQKIYKAIENTYIYIYILKCHYKEIENSIFHKGIMVKKYKKSKKPLH